MLNLSFFSLVFAPFMQQDQVSPAPNKEFDPLGPLPHGWGKT